MYSSCSARGTLSSSWPHAEREENVLLEPLRQLEKKGYRS